MHSIPAEEKQVLVNILCEWKVSQITISTNVVSKKWYRLGVNVIFLQQKPGFFKKGVLITFRFCYFGVIPSCTILLFSLFFFIFLLLPNFIIFPPPTPPPRFLRIFFHSRLNRPYIHPRHNFFFNTASWIVKLYTTTTTFFPSTTTSTFLLFPSTTTTDHHISIVFTPPIVFPQTGQFGQPQAKIAKKVKKTCFFKRNVSSFIASNY